MGRTCRRRRVHCLPAAPQVSLLLAAFVCAATVCLFSPLQAQLTQKHQTEPNPGNRSTEDKIFTVVNLNLAHGRGKAVNQLLVSGKKIRKNLGNVARVLGRLEPHVVALQEADAPSRWSGGFDHVQYLADAIACPHVVHGLHARSWLYEYGTALLSRTELIDARAIDFRPTPPTTTKGFVTARINWPGGTADHQVTLISVHLDFSRKNVRRLQTEEIKQFVNTLSGSLVVAGDLNGEWQDENSAMRQLVEGLNLKMFRPEGDGLGTYKSKDGKRLDWILISQDLEFVSYEVLPDRVSDHLAVVAEIRRSRPPAD